MVEHVREKRMVVRLRCQRDTPLEGVNVVLFIFKVDNGLEVVE
jgi:hypothetical protein